jgi:TATA-binding protein-associated factor Taf7
MFIISFIWARETPPDVHPSASSLRLQFTPPSSQPPTPSAAKAAAAAADDDDEEEEEEGEEEEEEEEEEAKGVLFAGAGPALAAACADSCTPSSKAPSPTVCIVS